ncbi:hypothetical protein ACFE04_029297 [Oxalis oulophora]
MFISLTLLEIVLSLSHGLSQSLSNTYTLISLIDKSNSLPVLTESSAFLKEYKSIDDEIDDALRILRRLHEREYIIAEDTLNEHRRYLNNMLEQLEKERKKVAHDLPGNDTNTFMKNVLVMMKQVKPAKRKMKELEKVKNGLENFQKMS